MSTLSFKPDTEKNANFYVQENVPTCKLYSE